MKWTKEQLEAIEVRDKNILVSAAAGSGKTAVLVERIKRILKEDKIPLSDLLVVTFTNAAASEMREKIVTAIPEQINQIHKAHISTFHSFALDVIRRHFHLTDLAPGFHICDETKATLLKAEAMEGLFRLKFKEEDPDFLMFLRLYGSGKHDESVKNMILTTHRFLQSLPEPFPWLESAVEALSESPEEFKKSPAFLEMQRTIMEELDVAIATQGKVNDMIEDAGIASLTGKAAADLDGLKKIRDAFLSQFDEGSLAIRSLRFQTYRTSKQEQESFDLIHDDIQALRKNIKNGIADLKNRFCARPLEEYLDEMAKTRKDAETLYKLVTEFHLLYKKQKEKQSLIDFSDIEHYALDILGNEEAAQEYRNQFQYLFIDEYQDSNLVQECLINRIKRENNVFMVGDVKQSIYKFRLAEPEIFMGKYEDFRKGEDPSNVKLDLNRNFRSKGPIIEAVNQIFRRTMKVETAGMNYDKDAELYRGVEYEGPLAHSVELHLLSDRQVMQEGLDEEILEMKRAELEAFTAASIIKQNRGLPYYDVSTNEERQLALKDMVILLRSTSGIGDIYREALEKEGIPAFLDTGDGFFDTQEIAVFLNLLRIIDNHKQDIPLLSILRSSIFGFPVDSLAKIRLGQKKGAYHKAFFHYAEEGPEESLREKCRQSLERVRRWRQRAGFLPLDDFLWELLSDSGYYNYVGALPGGGQRQGNLRALADKAAAYEAGQAKGLSGFISYVEAMQKGKIPTAPVKLLGEGDDVVRIMTVHKSKGLEFPMVLAGNLAREFYHGGSEKVSIHKEFGLALPLVDRDNCSWQRTLLQEIIDAKSNREDLAEEIRVLYVSLTRPMDKLVLLGTVSDTEKALDRAALNKELEIVRGKSFLDFLMPSLIQSDKVQLHIHDRGVISAVKTQSAEHTLPLLEGLEKGFPLDEDVVKPVYERLCWNYAFPMALHTKSKYSVSELSKETRDSTEGSPGKTAGESAAFNSMLAGGTGTDTGTGIGAGTGSSADGAARGNAYHKLMEHIPFEIGVQGAKAIETFAGTLVDRGIMEEQEPAFLDYVQVEGFFNSPVGKRAAAAKNLYREAPFILTKERNGERIIVQGIIDCYFEEDGEYILVDYKSNYLQDKEGSAEGLAEFYRPQMELYREALETIRGRRVAETYLYLFFLGREVLL